MVVDVCVAGMLRVCFVRKNKVLRSSFLGTTSVVDMLEANYRTWCAQNGVEIDDRPLAEGEGVLVDDVMEVDAEEDDEMEWTGFGDEDDDVPAFREEADLKAKAHTSKNGKRKKRGRVGNLVREKVERVLSSTGLAEKRARLCHQVDFLKLLWAFNQEGIHFS